MDLNSGTIIIGIIVIGILLIIISIFSMWKKVPQDKALIVTGLKKRVITGGGGLVIPVLERTDKISLENIKIEVRTDGALTKHGVGIISNGVAVIKVKSDNIESILSAVEQFNTGNEQRTINVIRDFATDVLEGKLREIVSTLTVEEIYKDREKFASQVSETADTALAQMGLEIKAFTIKEISDNENYLNSLGRQQIAEVKKNAEVAEAEALKETKIKTAEAQRLGDAAILLSEAQIAESTKNKELKVQEYRKEQETAKAMSDLAYQIESNKVKKEVTETEVQIEITKRLKEKELTEAEMQIEITRKQKAIELAEQEAMRVEKELDAKVKKQAEAEKYRSEKIADANRYRELQEAEAKARAIRLAGESEAEAIKLKGLAEAEVIMQKGLAEAEAMRKRAEAYQMYNEAAVAQMIIEKLPEVARAVAQPLSQIDKIVVVDNGNSQGGGASKITNYVTDILTQLPETVEALTGVNLMDLVANKVQSPKQLSTKALNQSSITTQITDTASSQATTPEPKPMQM